MKRERCAKVRGWLVRVLWVLMGVTLAGTVRVAGLRAQAEEKWSLQVSNMHNLYAVDLTLAFDPTAVEVIDADPDRPGVEIVPGPLFSSQAHFVVYNRVTIDEEAGVGYIEFVITLLNPAEPISGAGMIAFVPYRVVDAGAVVEPLFTIEEARLASRSGHVMLVEWEDNTIWQAFRLYLPLIAQDGGASVADSGLGRTAGPMSLCFGREISPMMGCGCRLR